MLALVVLFLVIWVTVIIIGFAVKALFWLGIVGIALFVITAGIGMGKLLKQ